MKRSFKKTAPLYLITDTGISRMSHRQIARRALEAGAGIIQLRDKTLSKGDLFREALAVKELADRHSAIFIMNDHVDIALAVNAHGVHLGQEDMSIGEARSVVGKQMIIGISTHNVRQAKAAEEAGADYIGFGPMFTTSTKDAGRPKGIKALVSVAEQISIPVVAIGGITQERACSVLRAGAASCAVISGVLKGDIRKNVGEFISSCRGCYRET